MAITQLVTRGLGPGATIAFLVTAGYSVGAAPVVVLPAPSLALTVETSLGVAWLAESTTGLTMTLGAPGTMRLTLEAVSATRLAADGS